jgi:hypothetical protein
MNMAALTCQWCKKEEVRFEVVVFNFHRGVVAPSSIPGRQGVAFGIYLCKNCLPFKTEITRQQERKR